MKFAEVVINPTQAQNLLSKNTDNRPVRWTHVRHIAGAIERGEWMLTHQAIAIDTNDRILDGQHRLLACKLANKPIRTMLATECAPETFLAVDLGARRSISDILGSEPKVTETVSRIALVNEGHSSRVTPAVVQRYGKFFAEAAEAVFRARAGGTRIITTTPMRAAVAIRVALGEGEYALETYKQLAAHNIDELLPCARSFLLRALEGKVPSHSTFDFQAMCWYVTSEANANYSRITLKNPQAYIDAMRKAVGQIMGPVRLAA